MYDRKIAALSAIFEKLAMSPDYAFSIFNLPDTANKTQIKKKYRELVNQFHPDRAKNPIERQQFHDKLVELNAAYPVALENIQNYISNLNEDEQIDKEVDRIIKEYGIVDSEESAQYGDWMEENPGEYEKRLKKLREDVVLNIRGPRYQKTKFKVAERALRSLDWKSLFDAGKKVKSAADALRTIPLIGNVFSMVVSSLEYNFLNRIRTYEKTLNIGNKSLEEVYGDHLFSRALFFLHELLEKRHLHLQINNKIEQLQQLSASNNVDVDKLVLELKNFEAATERFTSEFNIFYDLLHSVYDPKHLAQLPNKTAI